MKEIICVIIGIGLALGVTWEGNHYRLWWSQEKGGHVLVNDGK